MEQSATVQSRIPYSLIPLIIFFGLEGIFGIYAIIFNSIPNLRGISGNPGIFETALYLKKIYLAFYIVPAIALVLRKIWAQQIGTIILCVDLLFSLLVAVWAFLIFSPPLVAYLGFPLLGLWFYFWIKLLRRDSVAELLN